MQCFRTLLYLEQTVANEYFAVVIRKVKYKCLEQSPDLLKMATTLFSKQISIDDVKGKVYIFLFCKNDFCLLMVEFYSAMHAQKGKP